MSHDFLCRSIVTVREIKVRRINCTLAHYCPGETVNNRVELRKMNTITKVSLSYCRSNVYMIIGVCFGLCISSFFTPLDINECAETADEPLLPSALSQLNDLYEPKINVEGKPLRAKKTPKVFMRPRYYSTELGIREKLFVGVLTSQEYLYSRGVAQNKTIAHLVDKIRYFISIPEGTKPNVSLPGIVGFTDTRSILKPFHVLKYITDNYLEDYDYYFLIKDMTYVDVRKLIKLVDKISISQNVHLGVAGEIEAYCSLGKCICVTDVVSAISLIDLPLFCCHFFQRIFRLWNPA